MAQNYYTEDLSDFGFREIKMLSDILNAWVSHGLPDNFDADGVRAAFNRNSGYVFLTNNSYQVAMMNGDVLENYYNTPYNGEEGFLDDLLKRSPAEYHCEDIDYICDLVRDSNITISEQWQDYISNITE